MNIHQYVRPLAVVIAVAGALLLCLQYLASVTIATRPRIFMPNWQNQTQAARNDTRLVLDWTGFFRNRSHLESAWSRCRAGCAQNDCHFSHNRELITAADAVIFHMRDMHLDDLPKSRSPHQAFVFLSLESPVNTFNTSRVAANYFNSTMTYRNDSDIFAPYFRFVPRVQAEDFAEIEAIAAAKSKQVAWFVSNCRTDSKREAYVDALKAHIDVDVFGSCGDKRCPRTKTTDCDAMLKSDYRFYLAFENSVCRDYVTEKFARSNNLIVPVVLRASDYARFPPKSYVAADRFESARQLAEYLKMLSANQTAYLEYFQWRKSFAFELSANCLSVCQLCKRLHDELILPKAYRSIHDWWYNASCQHSFGKKIA